MKKNLLEKRLDRSTKISENLYSLGILNIVDYLVVELEKFLVVEDRYKGIMRTYLSNIDGILRKVYRGKTILDTEVFQKIVYLYKPLLQKEFARLLKKRLSRADIVITMIRKLLLVVGDMRSSEYLLEAKSLLKIIDTVWDNIKHPGKNDPLYNLAYNIREYASLGYIGKYPTTSFSLVDKPKERDTLDNPGTRGVDSSTGVEIEL